MLVGIFFAKPLNEMKLLTLPDVFGRKARGRRTARARPPARARE